jgi:predicted esterase
MSIRFTRALRRASFVCVVVATLLGGALSRGAAAGTGSGLSMRTPHALEAHARTSLGGETRGHYAATPVTLHAEGHELLAFPPSKTAAVRPITVVYLHGARGRAANGCPAFRSGASELGWLVCPEAIEAERDGSWSWGADVLQQRPVVGRAIRAAEARGASSEPGVAVGFSQGSYVALDLVKASFASFRGLVLLAAELHPNVKTLRDAGVRRVALGAGQRDASYVSLEKEALRMENEGLEARFFDLGQVGHTYVVDDSAVLRDAIAWAGGKD